MIQYFVSLCIISSVLSGDPPSELNIGAILPTNSELLTQAFRLSVKRMNSDPELLPKTKLIPLVEEADDSFGVMKAVCHLVDEGIVSLVGPMTSPLSRTALVICGKLGIPQISIVATDPMLSLKPVASQPFSTHLKMSPPDTYQNQALVALIRHFGWTKFALIIEESEDVLNGAMDLQHAAEANDWTVVTVQRFRYDCNGTVLNLTSHLSAIMKKEVRLIVLHCSFKYSTQIIDEATRNGMLTQGWVWLVTERITSNVDEYLTDDDGSSPSFLGLLGTALVVPNSTLLGGVLAELEDNGIYIEPCYQQIIARIYDAVLAVAGGLHVMLYVNDENFDPPPFKEGTCKSSELADWKWGRRLFREMYSIDKISGCFGPVKFTEYGFHHEINFDIVNFQPEGFVKVGIWNGSKLNMISNVTFPGPRIYPPRDYQHSLFNKTLKVGIIQEKPFIMKTMKKQNNIEDLEYEGLLIDLFLELKKKHKFKFILTEYREYGYKNPTTNKWDGLTKALIDKDIDIVLAPFTISSERQEVISFTKPFYNLGLAVLMPKPNSAAGEAFFAFLAPFDAGVWLLILTTMVFSSFAILICNNFIPKQLHQKQTQGMEMKRISLPQAIWWVFSSLVCPGTEVGKNNLASRIVMASWWLTAVILVAAYTAKLAAAMTVKHMSKGIESFEELVISKSMQYGITASSQTRYFFCHSDYDIYKKACETMTRNDWYVESSKEGIRKVRESYSLPEGNSDRFAFIDDLPSVQYAENQEPCNVQVIGRAFALQNYGLGLAKNSPYESELSVSILQMRENGFIEMLSRKWFTGTCEGRKTAGNEDQQQLNIWNLIGVFSCFYGGSVVAFSVVVFYWMKDAVETKKRVANERAIVPCRNYNNKSLF